MGEKELMRPKLKSCLLGRRGEAKIGNLKFATPRLLNYYIISYVASKRYSTHEAIKFIYVCQA